MTIDAGAGKNKKEEKVFVETKTIIPKSLWCPSDHAAIRHQFKAAKVYILADNPEKGFAICQEHGELVEVSISVKSTQQQGFNQPKETDKESDEDFFKKQLVDRVGHILHAHVYSIKFYLQYKSEMSWLKPPEPLLRLFVLYFDSTSSEKQEVDRISVLLQKFKDSFGLPCDLIDAESMGEQELRNTYTLCAHRASTSRLYGKQSGFSIRDEFSDYNGDTGYRFGRNPALLVYSREGIDFVLPHYASCKLQTFSLRSFSLPGIPRLPATTKWRSAGIKIYPFLVMLETATNNELKDVLDHLARAKDDLAKHEKK